MRQAESLSHGCSRPDWFACSVAAICVRSLVDSSCRFLGRPVDFALRPDLCFRLTVARSRDISHSLDIVRSLDSSDGSSICILQRGATCFGA